MDNKSPTENIVRVVLKKILEESLSASAIRILGIFTTTIGVLKGIDYIGFNVHALISQKHVSSLLLILFVYMSIELILAKRSLETGKDDSKSFMYSLERELQALFNKKQFRKILRLRDAMSRYLWVEGSLKTRITLGEFAEESALQLGDIKSQVAALIDDLGWTLVAVKEYGRATECIQHGGALAKKEGLVYWEAKAHRHLAGMFTIKMDYTKAYDELEKSRPLAEQIDDPIKKLEIIGGIEYAIAVTALAEKNLEKAEKHVVKSDDLRRQAGDASRIIRCVSLMGKIEFEKGNIVAAKDYFRKGLEEATAIGRRDEMIRNHLGLASIYQKENNFEKSNYHKKLSKELKVDTPVPYEIDDNDKELQKLGGKSNG